jgi:cellobiose phosphorylase
VEKILQMQRPKGNSYHQFNPLTLKPDKGEAGGGPDKPDYYSDDHLWSILAVCKFIKVTGDFDFLKKQIGYSADEKGTITETGTVLDHLERALGFSKVDVGLRGLQLAGFADWNDTVNLPRGAESLFTSNLYAKCLLEMIELAEATGYRYKALQYRADYRGIAEKINQHAWDGQWYVSYFNSDGIPIGSSKNEFGKVWLNAQTWPILSGVAPSDRALMAFKAIKKYLDTPNADVATIY